MDNLVLKTDFFQKITADEAIAIRLAEASTGSKWAHKHVTKLGELQGKYPQYKAAWDKLGITTSMDSVAVIAHIKDNHVVDKSVKKKIMRAVTEGDAAGATALMGGKTVLTL